MVFSSLLFIFIFLPLVLAATYFAPRKARNLVLLVASLGFYAWGEAWYSLVIVATIFINFGLGLLMARMLATPWQGWITAAAVIINLGMLAVFKYADFLVDNLNVALVHLGTRPIVLEPIHLPIGISFFTFQALSYVIDIKRGHVPPSRNLIDYAMYKAFFPQLIAGPIVRYVDVMKEVKSRVETSELFISGFRRFTVGLAKKVLIANTLSAPAEAIFALRALPKTPILGNISSSEFCRHLFNLSNINHRGAFALSCSKRAASAPWLVLL